MKIIWTRHAKERQKQWEIKLRITEKDVENTVIDPGQIVPGDQNVIVAQKKMINGLLRVPYVEEKRMRKILTVYWTSKVDRYWEEKANEDTL